MNVAFLLLTTASLAAGQAPLAPSAVPRADCGEICGSCVDPCDGVTFGHRLCSHLCGLFRHERSGQSSLDDATFHCITPSETPAHAKIGHRFFSSWAGRHEQLREDLRDIFGPTAEQREQRREVFHYMFDAPPDRREQRREMLRFIFGPSPG